ncbi:MAG: mycobactin biosynthesis salicylate synthase MbtI [Polyangiales bacterium]
MSYRKMMGSVTADAASICHQLMADGHSTAPFLYEDATSARIVSGTALRIAVIGDDILCEGSTLSGQLRERVIDPLAQIERLLAQSRIPEWVAYGYLGFDLVRYYSSYRKRIDQPIVDLRIPELACRLEGGRLSLRSMSDPAPVLASATRAVPLVSVAPTPMNCEAVDQRAWYLDAISTVAASIRRGELEKAVIAREVSLPGQLDVLATYVAARANSAPRRFAFAFEEVAGVGSSPDFLLTADSSGKFTTNALAGTRPRGETPAHDAALKRDLLADAKEVREHAISAALAEREVESIATQGTARLYDFMRIKEYRTTQHLTSRLSGTLAQGRTVFSAIRAIFPGVTVTGIEKAPALQWIDRLEREPRGVYGGAVGFIDSTGAADLAIALRSVFQFGGRVRLNAGAGVVAESDPEFEYTESLNKMRTMGGCVVLR